MWFRATSAARRSLEFPLVLVTSSVCSDRHTCSCINRAALWISALAIDEILMKTSVTMISWTKYTKRRDADWRKTEPRAPIIYLRPIQRHSFRWPLSERRFVIRLRTRRPSRDGRSKTGRMHFHDGCIVKWYQTTQRSARTGWNCCTIDARGGERSWRGC